MRYRISGDQDACGLAGPRLPRRRRSWAKSGSSSCGRLAVAFEDLDGMPADVGDVDRRLAWPDV